jgi:hypothetical protein
MTSASTDLSVSVCSANTRNTSSTVTAPASSTPASWSVTSATVA